MGNDWTCRAAEHDYVEVSRWADLKEPVRIFCRKCGWVRTITGATEVLDQSAHPNIRIDGDPAGVTDL